jgi:spore maturation protein CgeB
MNRGRRFRVLVVGPLYGGTLEIAGYAARALRSLGHEAEWLDFSTLAGPFHSVNDFTKDPAHRSKLNALYAQFCSGVIAARALDYKPDLVFALAQAPLIPEAIDELRRHGIPTAFWFVEDFRHMAYWKGLVSRYDAVFPFQTDECFREMEAAGVRHVHYLPAAADPEIHRPLALSPEDQDLFGSGVSFMGAAYYNRRRMLTGLIDFDFRIWGEGWPDAGPLEGAVQRNGARIAAEDAVRIYNATKINVNLHSSAYHEGVNPVGDSVNPRTFEIAACGGFQLVDKRSLLPDLFGEDEMATFDDLETLRDGVRRYLADPEARAAMAERGRARILAEHTYTHRMAEMFGFLTTRGVLKPSAGSDGYERVEDLVRLAGRESEVGAYLSRFKDRERISLDEIVADIRKGGGALSRTEGLFLLLKELGG